jgi:hypothetical protein
VTNAKVEWFLEELGCSNMTPVFDTVGWDSFSAFLDCVYRRRVDDRDVLEALDEAVSSGAGLWTEDWEPVMVAIEEMSWFDGDVTDENILKLGCYMDLIKHRYSVENWHHKHMANVRRAVVLIPEEFIFALTPETAVNEKFLFHLSTISVIDPDITFEYITTLGEQNLASAVATFWSRGVPAGYPAEVSAAISPQKGIFATIAYAKLLGDAHDADVSAEYLAGGLKLKLKAADVIRMASEGIPFEYLAAYYERETL